MICMKKVNLILVFFILLSFSAISQKNCDFYLPLKQNSGVQMQSFNAKGKLQDMADTKITKVTTEGEFTVATLHSVSMDAKGKEKENSSVDYTVKCNGSKILFSAQMFAPSQNMDAYKNMEIKTESSDMEFPSVLAVDATMPDANMKMKILNNGMQMMEMNITFTDRKVVSKENVTTPAGTFECYKISMTVNSASKIFGMNSNQTSKSVSYYSKGVGTVKTETFDKKGNLFSYSILTKIY
jgi:hypothetical protein